MEGRMEWQKLCVGGASLFGLGLLLGHRMSTRSPQDKVDVQHSPGQQQDPPSLKLQSNERKDESAGKITADLQRALSFKEQDMETRFQDIFLRHAQLDRKAFCVAIEEATGANIAESPFLDMVIKQASGGDETMGVSSARILFFETLELATVYKSSSRELQHEEFAELGGRFLKDPSIHVAAHLQKLIDKQTKRVAKKLSRRGTTRQFVFGADLDFGGNVSLAECIGMGLCLNAVAKECQEAKRHNENGLTFDSYSAHLCRLGFVDLARRFQGALAKSVFDRLDIDGNGVLDQLEFMRGVVKMLNPTELKADIRSASGWPGWQCFATKEQLQERVASLQTGDVILMGMGDPIGKFIQFSTQSPFSHIGVVVKHSAKRIAGEPNFNTEKLLRKYPFRRRYHKFCAPGVCRCYDMFNGPFPCSTMGSPGDVEIMESTGQGTHVYDFCHRLFEDPESPHRADWIAVRRLRTAPGREDNNMVEEFVAKVRGTLYSTVHDELHHAFQHDQAVGHDDVPGESFFCSKLIAQFYQHMGWLSMVRPTSDYLPGDFAESGEYSVQLNPGVELEELEIIHSEALGVTFPLRFEK